MNVFHLIPQLVGGLVFAHLYYLLRRKLDKMADECEERVKPEPDELLSARIPESDLERRVIHTALFFPDMSFIREDVILNKNKYWTAKMDRADGPAGFSPYMELIRVLDTATTSLDLCMYIMTFPRLANYLIDALNHNIRVRLICDNRENETPKSQVSRLIESGIEVRSNPMSTSCLMHNKFIIIDSKILINGSFNWTRGAILQNYDNALITTEPNIVAKYEAEFVKLWNKFGKHTS